MKYPLITVSYNEKARKEVYGQLSSLMGDTFAITSYCYDDFISSNEQKNGLVLITAPVIKDLVIKHLDRDCRYLIAKRTINPKNLSSLFEIPGGAEVLVVNNLYANAIEVIRELGTIGIRHVNFTPYDPREPSPRRFEYAITPGEIHLVPESVPNIIDIGTRLISLMTIAQIYFHFTGDALSDELLYSRYIKDLVSSTMELSRQVKENQTLQQQLKMVISHFEDGVVVTNARQEVTFHNEMAAKILDKDRLIGCRLDEIFPAQHPSEYSDVAFTQVGNKVIHVVSKEVEVPGNDAIRMITLKDLTSIKIIDQQYKKHKKYAENTSKYSFRDIVHKSRAMTSAIAKANARSDSTILITGESGVGKELVAQSIHNASAREKYPFIAINCAALSDTLLESELFGYEEGAFTGARKGGKKGLFELADDGTIFLDEIGDAPPSIQQKLLRVLQEKEIMRVTGDKIIPVNVRVIAATNKDLARHVERGSFRSDLYYRLNVLPLSIPALRERKEDIEILLRYLINKHGYHEEIIFDRKVLDMLVSYPWPGNVRELENIAEYIATIAGVSANIQREIGQYLMEKVQVAGGKAGNTAEPIYFRDSGIESELALILRVLGQARERHEWIGRFKLREALAKDNLHLTEPQIKNRLNLLKKEQLIVCHNGKGSVITAKGAEYLRGI